MEPEVGEETAEALRRGRPIVALESTIFSELGLPSPHNRVALERSRAAVSTRGAVPAVTAVLDGRPVVGVAPDRDDLLCGPARKVAARDLAVAATQGWPYGATTVSASLRLAAASGVEVFATGGIGGVHRNATDSGDVSADLDELARRPVVAVSAGAKVFLDLARTLEYLETAAVPVLGWRCDTFPAFHSVSSGLDLDHRVEQAAEVAAIARAHWRLGGAGLLVVAPVPVGAALDLDEVRRASEEALAATEAAGITGGAVTPAVLERMVTLTGGRALAANLALAENNAAVAAEIAVALAASG